MAEAAAHSRKLLFLLGRGRSGTTLLSRLLDQHSGICFPPEGFLVRNLYPKYARLEPDAGHVDMFLEDLFSERRIGSWGLPENLLRDRLMSHKGNLYFQEILETIYCILCEQQKKPFEQVHWLGDKNPHYALFPGWFCKHFPQARFVYLHRDYRDNVNSYKQVPFDSSSTGVLAARWALYNRRLMATEEAYPERFFRLSYEGLVRHTHRTLSELLRWLDLDDLDSLPATQGKVDGFFGEGNPWHERINQPVDTKRMEAWREELDESEIRVIEAICKGTGQKLGYQPEPVKLPTSLAVPSCYKFLGRGTMFGEEMLFRLPLRVRATVINRYRSRTGRT